MQAIDLKWCRHQESNPGPTDYKSAKLFSKPARFRRLFLRGIDQCKSEVSKSCELVSRAFWMTVWKLFVSLCLILSLLLWADMATAQDLRHTFVFSTPFIDEHGDKDKSNDTAYPQIVIEAPAAPDEMFDIRGLLGPYPLSGSCWRSEVKRYNCQLTGPFVAMTLILYLDGKETWGEVQAVWGMFGSAYNLLGLLKSEPAK